MSTNYESIINDNYLADVNRFSKFDGTVINFHKKWVGSKTAGLLPDLLDETDAKSDLSAMWVNAMHFQGLWTKAFNQSRIKSEPFYNDYPMKSSSKNVWLMTVAGWEHYQYTPCNDEGLYGYDDIIDCALLPYGNTSFLFVGVLPPKKNPK